MQNTEEIQSVKIRALAQDLIRGVIDERYNNVDIRTSFSEVLAQYNLVLSPEAENSIKIFIVAKIVEYNIEPKQSKMSSPSLEDLQALLAQLKFKDMEYTKHSAELSERYPQLSEVFGKTSNEYHHYPMAFDDEVTQFLKQILLMNQAEQTYIDYVKKTSQPSPSKQI